MKTSLGFCALALVLVLCGPLAAATLHVPADYATIQQAIDAAASGDTVELACGVYTEPTLQIQSKDIVLRSAAGDPSCVTLSGQEKNRVLRLFDVTGATVIEGITIEDGKVTGAGGGVGIFQSTTPLIRNCVIRKCESGSNGAGMYISQSDPTIEDCTFIGNRAPTPLSGKGGAIWLTDSDATVRSCVFFRNYAAAGGAILSQNSDAKVRRSTFVVNGAADGSGAHINVIGSGSLFAIRCIFAFSLIGDAVSCNVGSSTATVTLDCCDVFGNEGGDFVGCLAGLDGTNDNFSADPLFCRFNPNGFDSNLHLYSNSPCARKYTTDCGIIGARDVGCGPVSVDDASWSGVKARYR